MTVDVIKERRELLLGIYQENRCQARHYEAVRATVVSFTLAAAVAISALIAKDGLNPGDQPMIIVLAVIGVYGTVFTGYYFKRIDVYEQLAKEFCKELDRLLGTEERVNEPRTLKDIQKDAKRNYNEKFSWRGLWRGLKSRELEDRELEDRELRVGDLFRMYWPITISLLAVLIPLLKFKCGWDI